MMAQGTKGRTGPATLAEASLAAVLLGTAVPAAAQTVLDVDTEAELQGAIFQASNDFAADGAVSGGPYTINVTGDITLTRSLPMIRGDGASQITINGNGNTIDAADTGRVFFVESGRVRIENVEIDNAVAQGGQGGDANNDSGGGGGGGLGAGAAVFVNRSEEHKAELQSLM